MGMKKIFIISILIFSSCVNAQTPKDEIILIRTSEGEITVHLDAKRAPITVSNFISLIK